MNNLDERYRAPQSSSFGSRTEETPALWNPNAAACWSLLFSPVFGAALHMLNARAMGDEELEKQNKFFMWGIVAIILIAIPISIIFGVSSNFLGVALLGAWYGGVGRKQVALVREKYGADYPLRSWGKPILFGILGVAGLFLYSFLVAFMAALMGLVS